MRAAAALVLAVATAAAGCANGSDLVGDGRLIYVAMGDSYTSGPGVPDEVGPPGCDQSDGNYPHLVAAAIEADVFRDVSCTGAHLDDVTQAQDVDGGEVPPQIDAVDEDADVVTIGMGGNDVGFISLVRDCIRLAPPPVTDPCSDDITDDDPFLAEIDAMGEELADTLDAIHDAAPRADVLVVGYPAALPDDGDACWPDVPIVEEDMETLVGLYRLMNEEMATTAALSGATYVDTYESSIDHHACRRPGDAWVNGIITIPASFPAHPNHLSFENTAREVVAAVEAR